MAPASRNRQWLILFQKKRGEHRTISPRAAFWAELGIFLLVLLAGLIGLSILVSRIFLPYWRAINDYRPRLAVVREMRILEQKSEAGAVFRPEILVEFEVDSRTKAAWAFDPRTPLGNGYLPDRRAAERVLGSFRQGGLCLVYVNPENGTEVFVFRELPWWIWLVLFVPLSLVILGGVGLAMVVQAGKERSLLAQVTASSSRFLLKAGAASSQLWPTIPPPLSSQDSPGVRLPIRLPLMPTELGNFFGWFLGSLLWNGASLTVLTWAWTGVWAGQQDWLFFAFACLLVVVGAAWLGAMGYFVARQWRVGPTIVEISGQPLIPGGRYQVYVAQFGHVKVNRLSISLVCEERVVFPEGTETRTESREVAKIRLFRREAFEVRSGLPFEAFFDLDLPVGVMHSFRSPHNQIVWMILVEKVLVGLTPIKRYFPVVVYPRQSGKVTI